MAQLGCMGCTFIFFHHFIKCRQLSDFLFTSLEDMAFPDSSSLGGRAFAPLNRMGLGRGTNSFLLEPSMVLKRATKD